MGDTGLLGGNLGHYYGVDSEDELELNITEVKVTFFIFYVDFETNQIERRSWSKQEKNGLDVSVFSK